MPIWFLWYLCTVFGPAIISYTLILYILFSSVLQNVIWVWEVENGVRRNRAKLTKSQNWPAGPVILKNKRYFFSRFPYNPPLLSIPGIIDKKITCVQTSPISFVTIHWHDIFTTRPVWSAISDKLKVPSVCHTSDSKPGAVRNYCCIVSILSWRP